MRFGRHRGDGDTGLTESTLLRHDLTEIKPKFSEISNSLKFKKSFEEVKNWTDRADWADWISLAACRL